MCGPPPPLSKFQRILWSSHSICRKIQLMSRTATPSIDVDIFEKVVAPHEPTFSRPVARAVQALVFTDAQKSEMHRLLDKNNAGTITEAERAKLEGYTRVGNLLNLLKAKARVSLSKAASH